MPRCALVGHSALEIGDGRVSCLSLLWGTVYGVRVWCYPVHRLSSVKQVGCMSSPEHIEMFRLVFRRCGEEPQVLCANDEKIFLMGD
jgi:hypothetical protein